MNRYKFNEFQRQALKMTNLIFTENEVETGNMMREKNFPDIGSL